MKMEQDVLEGNKLIAEFMGLRLGTAGDLINGDAEFHVMGLRYNSSWDWLMTVVEKIEKAGLFQFVIKPQFVKVQSYNPFHLFDISVQGIPPNTKIEATWLAVVDFINWYNKQPKNSQCT